MMRNANSDTLDLILATHKHLMPELDRDFFTRCLFATKGSINKNQNSYALCIKICDEEESKMTNNNLRGIDKSTNVIAIDYETNVPTQVQFLGDILLCAPVIWQEANAQGIKPKEHWAHITIHGMLHLLGFDHVTDEMENLMQSHEKKALQLLSMPYQHIGK